MSVAYAWSEHRVFPAGEGALLLDVERASLFRIDADAREALGRWQQGDPVVWDRVPEPEREVLEAFRSAGVLAPPRPRPAPRPAPDPAEIPLGTLVLDLAQACNLRCAYCYAGGGAYGGEARLMSAETARRAVRHLVARSGRRDPLTVVLFGGEPLLNLPALQAAAEEAEARGRAAGKRVQLSLTTNATLVTPEVVELLRRHRVGVSVSLDGPPDLHDANRPLASGGGSYAAALEGLRALLAAGAAPVAARVTLTPSQWGRVEEVFDHLLGLGFHEVGIAPASPVREALLPDAAQEEALLAGFAALARRFRRELERGRVVPFSNLLDLLARIHTGQVRSAACGAGRGYLAVDAGGDLYLCHRFAGDGAFRVGSLGAGADPGRLGDLLASLAPGTECAGCWARALCGGGCHYENHLRRQLPAGSPGDPCRFVRSWLELGMETYAQVRSPDGEDLLGRLEARITC